MTVLGIDTSSARCAVAVAIDGRIAARRSSDAPRAHSETLLGMIDECLAEAGCGSAGADGVAVAAGPGSFTGLRIGFSTAKGICAASGCLFAPVPTFEAWVRAAAGTAGGREGILYLPVMPAGRDEVFAGTYRLEGGLPVTVGPARLMPGGDLAAFAAGAGECIVVSERPADAATWLPGRGGAIIPVPGDASTAEEVAVLGWKRILSGATEDVRTSEPVYLKEFSYKLPAKKGA